MNKEELAKRLYEISLVCFETGSPWKKEQFFSFLTQPFHHYVTVTEEDNIIGFLLLTHLFEEAEIELIGVSPDYQRTGMGSKLLEKAKVLLANTEAESIFIEVRKSNQKAQQFYQKEGFTMIGERKQYYHHPKEDALIWQLRL